MRIATASVRTGFAMTGSFTWGAVDARAGKSAKRRQWRMQRGDFEEVPRLAATTVAGNRLARRWAREPRPYEVTRGAVQVRAGRPGGRPLRKRILRCVGEGLCPSRGRPQGSPLRSVTRSAVGRVVREADPYGGVTRRAVQIKGGPAGRPYGFYIHFLYLISTFYMRFAENQSPRGRGLPV